MHALFTLEFTQPFRENTTLPDEPDTNPFNIPWRVQTDAQAHILAKRTQAFPSILPANKNKVISTSMEVPPKSLFSAPSQYISS